MAACTSRAAPSMLRLRSNWRVTLVLPSELDEVISVMPAMWLNWRSKGVAIAEAVISGLAPGKLAETEIVGKSTCGKGETGRTLKAMAPTRMMPAVSSVVATCGSGATGSTTKAMPPAMATATVSSVVATGRRMNGDERLMRSPFPAPACWWLPARRGGR